MRHPLEYRQLADVISQMTQGKPAGYPILLNLHNRRCVVVGGGEVAARKVRGLLRAGAQVTVISPELQSELMTQHWNDEFEWKPQCYQNGMLEELNPVLVFAATNSFEVNRQVKEEARVIGAPVNTANEYNDDDFSNMACLDRSPLMIAIATNGASPALGGHLKEMLDEIIGEEYAILARWLGEIRSQIRQSIPDQSERKRLFQSIIDSDVLDLLRNHDQERAHQRLRELLREWVSV